MAVINNPILQREFERVRERIFVVLADELPNQATLNPAEPFLSPMIGMERMIRLDKSNGPFVNIKCATGEYSNYKLLAKDGTYTYFIDCYMDGTNTDTKRADTEAQRRLQRLVGVIDGILSSTKYVTLGWERPSISRAEVTEIIFPDDTEQNASNYVMARLIYSVRIPETVAEFEPNVIAGYVTQQLIDDTVDGYVYGNTPPPPVTPPVCDPVIVENSDQSYQFSVPSGDTHVIPDINITLNSLGFLLIPAALDQDIILEDTSGNEVTPVLIDGNKIIVLPSGGTCPDATVSNSDDSYSTTVPAGGNLELPDIEVTINGSSQGDFPSVQDLDFTVSTPCNSLNPTKTGWVTSVTPGDDGDEQRGRDDGFTTLDWNNPYGNTNRWTDELGGQDYLNDIYIDWTTYRPDTQKVTAYAMSPRVGLSGRLWLNWMADQPFTIDGKNDWMVANINEATRIANYQTVNILNYAPLNYPVNNGSQILYTSTLHATSNARSWAFNTSSNIQPIANAIFASGALLVRDYTYDPQGGTLS